MAFTQDFRTQRRNYDDGESRIGEKDRLWYDPATNTIRVSDGETPGGVTVGGAGGTNYTLPTATTTVKGGVKIDGTTISISEGVISGFSGSYTDLSNKPTIPSNTNQLTNGAGYITSASLPTATSDLSNDSGFLTTSEFDLNTIDLDASNKLHATGVLPGDSEGFTAVFAGRAAGVAALPNTVIQSQAQVNDYAQNNFQNTNDGTHASTEWVATSPNGDDSNYYIDLGINGASWDGTASNSLYTNVGQRDGWLYVQGGNAGGGNLILGTSLASTYTKIIAGDASVGDTEVARFSSTEIKLKKQLTFNDNTTQTTAWLGTYSYNDLTDPPTLVTSYNDLTDLPSLFSGSYNDLTNKPTLFSGAYDDLTGKPTLFSGSYNDLTDVPGAPTIALGDLTDVDLTTPPTIGQVLKYDGTKWAPGTDITSGGAGTDADTLDGFDSSYFLNYNNFTNKPTIPTTVTVNGTAITLGSSGTVTANTTNALTIGTGLKGTASTFDGSAANTISLDTSVTAVTATAGATTTLSAATLTRYYQVTGTLSGTHIFRLPDLTTLTAGQQITFFTSQGIITYQLSTGTQIVSNSIATARQTTFTVVSNAANTTANLSYTQVVPGLVGTGTSLLTNVGPSISTAYITGLDSTSSTTAYASTPTLGIGPTSTAFNTTLNMYTAALVATWSKTINFGTGLNGGTSTINIGTGVTSGTASVNIGSSTSTVQMNGAVTITSLTATNSIVGSITGNAATATKLGTARTINNVSFDGSESITVTANTTNALTIGSGLSGTSFNGSTAVTIAVDSTVALRADTTYIGTTSIALNRSSASQTLTGVSIDGNAATVTNGLYSTGSYANPAWITSLAYSKISGAPTIPVNVSELTNDSGYATLTGAETLTNKTLTLPTVGGTGATFNGSSSGTTVLKASSAAGTTTITLPARTGTVITSADTGTVTNAMLEGNIANAKLFNSSVTIGSTVLALGTTAANLEGLNSVTATNFIGNASTVTNGVYTNSIGVVTDIMLAGSIANNKLTNSSITVNGTSISLGSSATITAANPNALTIGTGLSGTSYTGGSAVTIAIDSTVATLTGSQTLTNKTLTLPTIGGTGATFNGSTSGTTVLKASAAAGTTTITMPATTGTVITTGDSGTVTNTMLAGSIANSKLANSAVTVNGTSISLGSSATIEVNSIKASGFTSSLGFDGAGNLLLSNNSTIRHPTSLILQTGGPAPYYEWEFDNSGNLTFPDTTVQSTAWLGSTDTIIKVAGSFAADQPFKAEVVADTTYGVTIETWTGLPAFATSNSWEFGYDGGMTFPDSTVQTTAYTAAAAKGLLSVSTATASGAGSLNYSDGVFTFTPPAGITVNGTAISLGGSATVTAAAGTLTGTTLNSTVVSSSLTSVGTLTSLSSGAITTTGTLAVNASGGITTNQTTFPLVNTTASTINFAGAATTLNIGYSSTTGSNTTNIVTAAQQSGTTKTVNIGTGSAVGSTTNVNLGSTSGTSTVAVNGALTTSSNVSVTYTPATATGQAIQATGKDTVGGTGYFDFFKATNTTSGVANGSKTMRLNSVGTLEILNSAYNATILSVTDAGFIAINAASGVSDGVPANNAIAMNSNSYIYDDGNYHLTSKTGSVWINANDGSAVNINTQMPTGITGGGMNVQGAVKSYGAGSTAFISSGSNVVSGVALQLDSGTAGTAAQMAIRDTSTVASTMYFDVSTGGSAHGSFQFRSSNAFTQLMSLSNSQIAVNKQMLIGGGSQGAYVTINGTNTYNINGPFGYLNGGGAGSINASGSTGNQGFSLQCSGRIQAGEVDVPSDERLKDIQGTIPLDRALQFVQAVDGILYTWKPGFGDNGLKSGFSAQGVYKAGFDHMVVPVPNDRLEGSTDADGFTSPDKAQLSLDYLEAIPYHHEVIKHLLDRIEQLEARLADKKQE